MPSIINRLNRSIYIFIASSGLAVGLFGCGFDEQALFVDPDDAGRDNPSQHVIQLDWTGGTSPIMGDDDLPGLAFNRFMMPDGTSLAELEPAFKSRVVEEVQRIFSEVADMEMVVEEVESDGRGDDTVVLITQTDSQGLKRFGEGEYDPCNEHEDDVAVIFGEELLEYGGTLSFDDWVMVFANSLAHEIGHTLGWAHVSREEYPPNGRQLYVELMYDQHTMTEMRRPQRFLVEQSNCDHDE